MPEDRAWIKSAPFFAAIFRRQNIPVALNTHTLTPFSHLMKNKLSPLILATCLLQPVWVSGQNIFLNNVGDGNWHNHSNWTMGIPTSSHQVRVSNNRTADISGANAVSGTALIGYTAGQTGTVNVLGVKTWTINGSLGVGEFGAGILNISGGGNVITNDVGVIGYDTGSTGQATVTGANSLWQNSSLYVGYQGSGTLTVEAGGTVRNINTHLAYSGPNSQGTLYLNGTSGSRAVLETGYLIEGSGTLGGTINFNGGILRATGNQPNFIRDFEAETGDVEILSGGAFIDTEHNAVGYNVGISTVLQGEGGLTKQGSGTLTLSGASTYEGSTTVEKGTLALAAAGSIASSEEIRIQAGAELDVTAKEGSGGWTLAPAQTLSGGGTVSGLVVMGSSSILSPGNSVGQLSGTSAIWEAGSIYDWEIQDLLGDEGMGWDHYLLTGTLTLEGGFTLKMTTLGAGGELAGWNPAASYSWTILTASSITGFDEDLYSIDDSLFANAHPGVFSLAQEDNSLVLHYDGVSAIPEPGSAVTLALLLTSSIGLHRQRRKGKR